MKLQSLIACVLLVSASLAHADISGRAANGCTYRVINGQYLTDCSHASDSITQNSAAPAPSPAPQAANPQPQIVENYNAVPLRQSAAPISSTAASEAPAPTPIIIQQAPAVVPELDRSRTQAEIRHLERDRYYDATYLGMNLGGASFSNVSAGSALGIGATIGTNLDNFLGIEIGYSYAKQNLNLGLASRSGSTGTYSSNSGSDSTLTAHLLNAELQAHLTDTYKRLRPYAGAGLAYKHANLMDDGTGANSYYGAPAASNGSTLSQNSIGATGSLGLKFRFTETLQALAFVRYYLPLSNQEAKLSLNNSNAPMGSTSGARLNSGDNALTSSSLYQISGGLQYAF